MGLLTGLRNFRFSRVLFQDDEQGLPKLFILSPTTDGETVAEAEYLIQCGGGVIVTKHREDGTAQSNVIKLCIDAERDLIQKQGFVPISFLRCCILKNYFFDPHKFRKKIVDTYVSDEGKRRADASDDDMGVPTTFMRASSLRLSKGRMKYTDQEDLNMIEHVVRYGLHTYKGRDLWKQIEHRKLTTHTAESMRSRFLKTILPNIGLYRIPRVWKRKLGIALEDDSDDDLPLVSLVRDKRDDDDEDNGHGDDTSSVAARRELRESQTRGITPGVSRRNNPPHNGNTSDTPSTSRDAHSVLPAKPRRVSTIPAMFTRPSSRNKPVTRLRETTDSDDDDCVIVKDVQPKSSPVHPHRSTKKRSPKQLSTTIRCCGPDEGFVIQQCLSQGYDIPGASKLQALKVEKGEEEKESRSREEMSGSREKEKCSREEEKRRREEEKRRREEEKHSREEENGSREKTSENREDKLDRDAGKRKTTIKASHRSSNVGGGGLGIVGTGCGYKVDNDDDYGTGGPNDDDGGAVRKRRPNDDDGKRKPVGNDEVYDDEDDRGTDNDKRQASTKASNRKDNATNDTRIPEQVVVVTDSDADTVCDTASEDLVLRLPSSEDEKEKEEGKQEKKETESMKENKMKNKSDENKMKNKNDEKMKNKNDENKMKNKNDERMVSRVSLRKISTSCLSDDEVSGTMDDEEEETQLSVRMRKGAVGVAQEPRSRSRSSLHTSSNRADLCHGEQEESTKGSPASKVLGSQILRPTFRTKMPSISSKVHQDDEDIRRAVPPGRKLSTTTTTTTIPIPNNSNNDNDTDSNYSIAGSAVSTGCNSRDGDGVSWRMLHQPLSSPSSTSKRAVRQPGTQQRFTRVFHPNQPPSTSKVQDEEGRVDVHTCVSKEVTRRRVQAVMRHYKIDVNKAVELMIRNQEHWWSVVT